MMDDWTDDLLPYQQEIIKKLLSTKGSMVIIKPKQHHFSRTFFEAWYGEEWDEDIH